MNRFQTDQRWARWWTLAQRYRYLLIANGLLLAFFVWIAIYVKVAALTNSPDREQRFRVLVGLFQDPFTRTRPYLGLLTSVSELLWCIVVVLCATTVMTLWRLRQHRHISSQFLQVTGVFVTALLLDEVLRLTLLLNAVVGIPKIMMYLAYLIGAVAISLRFGRYIRQTTPYALLLIAGGLFIISALADALPLIGRGSLILLEDGTKLLGLVNLLAYFWQVTQANLVTALEQAGIELPGKY